MLKRSIEKGNRHRDIEFKLAPAMLLNLKGMHSHLSRGVWKGGVQVEDHLTPQNSPQCLSRCLSKPQSQEWEGSANLFDYVTDVLSTDSSDVQIPLVGLCLGCL